VLWGRQNTAYDSTFPTEIKPLSPRTAYAGLRGDPPYNCLDPDFRGNKGTEVRGHEENLWRSQMLLTASCLARQVKRPRLLGLGGSERSGPLLFGKSNCNRHGFHGWIKTLVHTAAGLYSCELVAAKVCSLEHIYSIRMNITFSTR
jgi:hypothetical protein